MFRQCSEEDREACSSAGTRPLFRVGSFVFQDGMDGEGALHHLLVEQGTAEGEAAYEVDQGTMYELVARYLSGEYEKEAYHLPHSPAHHALLDLLELATARARGGDTEFSLTELDGSTEEVLDDDEPEDEAR